METKSSQVLDEFRNRFKAQPEIVKALEAKLERKGETLVDFSQINGDNITFGSPLFLKGPAYWYGIWTQDKQENRKPMVRISDYIGIESPKIIT